MGSALVTSKWRKTQILAKSEQLAPSLPETRRMTASALRRMLDRYGMAYVKPERGSRGRGVMKVEKAGGRYRIHAGVKRVRQRTFREAYAWIMAHKQRRPYLAQRGIRVIRHRGRPVDFRVMVQRRSDRSWEVSGMLARVAHPRKAVTNGSQGGSIYAARRILVSALGRHDAARLQRRMRNLGLLTAARLSRPYPGLNEIGLDIAIGKRRRSWILEVNTRPDATPFKLLRNRAMLRRIVQLGRGYGRRYDLRVKHAKQGK